MPEATTDPTTTTTPATTAPLPQVWCVDVQTDDDYDSYPELDRVFTTKDAADAYAAQIIAPAAATVYPMALFDQTPTVITNYRHLVSTVAGSARASDSLFANHRTGYRYDPATARADVRQFIEAEMGDQDTLDPVTVTIHPEASNGLTLIEVAGTDRDAVNAAFVAAFHDVENGRHLA